MNLPQYQTVKKPTENDEKNILPKFTFKAYDQQSNIDQQTKNTPQTTTEACSITPEELISMRKAKAKNNLLEIVE